MISPQSSEKRSLKGGIFHGNIKEFIRSIWLIGRPGKLEPPQHDIMINPNDFFGIEGPILWLIPDL